MHLAFRLELRSLKKSKGYDIVTIYMAKTSSIAKSNRPPKFSTRAHSRCKLCGRPRGYMRDFGMCRICFRENAEAGHVPGIRKSSW